jgi:hypothetical protein
MEFQNGGGEFFAREFAINVPLVECFGFGRDGEALKANSTTAISDGFLAAGTFLGGNQRGNRCELVHVHPSIKFKMLRKLAENRQKSKFLTG